MLAIRSGEAGLRCQIPQVFWQKEKKNPDNSNRTLLMSLKVFKLLVHSGANKQTNKNIIKPKQKLKPKVIRKKCHLTTHPGDFLSAGRSTSHDFTPFSSSVGGLEKTTEYTDFVSVSLVLAVLRGSIFCFLHVIPMTEMEVVQKITCSTSGCSVCSPSEFSYCDTY